MKREQFWKLIEAASASPSVHNVQPARWHIDGHELTLLEDPSRRLTIGDPTGNDAGLSLGAVAEGMVIAASDHGLHASIERCEGRLGRFTKVARVRFEQGGERDSLAGVLSTRASYRAAFAPVEEGDKAKARSLSAGDCTVVFDPADIVALAKQYDQASYAFMRQDGFRAELLGWMRLKRSHANWSRDGLNAEAMKLSAFEAMGAGAVLGWLFRPLATLGLAPALLSEAKSFANAAAVVLFHRPKDEDPFESGRRFHRLWLEIDAAGFGASVLAAVADHKPTADAIADQHGIPSDHRLVSAFRIGRREGSAFDPARLPVEELLVSDD